MKTVFEKYRKRLVKIGLVKALIAGLIFGFSVDLILASAAWFIGFNGLWLSVGVGAAITLIATLLFYRLRFRPTTGKIARMIDRLGLEERMITMCELENDDAYIAMKQREDAKEKLRGVSAKALCFRLSKAALTSVIVLGLFSATMTTIAALSSEGVVPSGSEIMQEIIPPSPEDFVELTYLCEEGGTLVGEPEQIKLKGESADPVVAVADDGWVFLQWDDGWTDPERNDVDLTKNLTVTAIFEEIGDGEDPMGGGGLGLDEDVDGQIDQPGDQPGQGEGADAAAGSGEGNGKPADGNGDGEGKSDSQSSGESEGGGRGENSTKPDEALTGNGSSGYDQADNNTVLDGQTDYHTITDFEEEQNNLAADEELPAELKDIISGYLDSLKP